MRSSELIQMVTDRLQECEALRNSICDLCPTRDGKLPTARSLGMKLHHLRRRVVSGGWMIHSRPSGLRELLYAIQVENAGLIASAEAAGLCISVADGRLRISGLRTLRALADQIGERKGEVLALLQPERVPDAGVVEENQTDQSRLFLADPEAFFADWRQCGAAWIGPGDDVACRPHGQPKAVTATETTCALTVRSHQCRLAGIDRPLSKAPKRETE